MRASLIGASGVDLDVLASLLAEADIRDLWVIKNVVGDGVMFDPTPDVVIAALDAEDVGGSASPQGGFNNFDVLLRIGQALALGIPSLLVVPPSLKPPSWIRGLSIALCSPGNRDSLMDHVWALTARASKGSVSKTPSEKFTPIDVEHYLARLKAVEQAYRERFHSGVGTSGGRVSASAYRFEGLVSELLISAGAALAEPPEVAHRNDYADFAFIPSSGSSVVVLAECKLTSRKRRLSEDEASLYQKVAATHSQLGLLIYHPIDGLEPIPARHATALVERISATDLIERLGEKSLQKVISDAVAQAASRS